MQPDERRLAGVVGGMLFLVGALTLPLLLMLPGVTHAHRGSVLAITVVTLAWGASSAVAIDWWRAPRWLIHLTPAGGLVLIALAIAATGGADSPAWIYVFLDAVFASYFFGRPVAALYLLGCVLIHALPLMYSDRATSGLFLAQFAIAVPSYLVLGGAITVGKRRMLTLRSQAERLADQQGALRRVATAVVGGESAERIYELVATEAAGLLRGNAAGILRIDAEGLTSITGSSAEEPSGRYLPGTAFPIKPGSEVERAIRTGRPAWTHEKAPSSALGRLGYRSSIVAPIRVDGEIWGVVLVAGKPGRAFTSSDGQRLTEFSDLLATAIASLDDRARLAAQALTDPLTGVANHGAFQQRLAAESARASRHRRTLSVAVIDIDHFKQLNDSVGHEAGDAMLTQVAQVLRGLARAEDTLGRIGGDEFAWLLPDTTR